MGYLPTVSKRLEADLVHHIDNHLSLPEIKSEVDRLQDIEASLSGKKIKKVKSRTIKGRAKND